MSDRIRILIADDHPIVRQGLATLLVPRNGMEVVGEATNGREAVKLEQSLQPDVVMMDMVMPQLNGSEATAQIMARNPQARVLILTSFGDEDKLVEAISAGALGCVLKDSPPDELLQAIRSVHHGQISIPQSVAVRLINQPAERAVRESLLTEREEEIAALVAEGLSNKEIGYRLDISRNTVRSHVSNIFGKLNLTNRTQLAIYLTEHADQGK